MIIGIGTDILDLRRLKKIIKKYDQKFINRIYGQNEILIAKSKSYNAENFFGKRFSFIFYPIITSILIQNICIFIIS